MAPQLKITRLMCARQSFVKSRAPLEDNAHVLMEYDNGAIGSLWSSAVNCGSMHGQKVRIIGEKASLEWWDEQPNQLRYEMANPCASSSAVWTISIRWRVRMIASAAAIPRACLRHGRISIAASPSPWMPPTVATRRCWPTSGTGRPRRGVRRPLGGKLRAFCRQRRLLGRLPLTRRLRAFVMSLYGYFSVRASWVLSASWARSASPRTLRRHSIAREAPAYRARIDLQFAEVA